MCHSEQAATSEPYEAVINEDTHLWCIRGPGMTTGFFFGEAGEINAKAEASARNAAYAEGKKAANADLLAACKELADIAESVYDTIPSTHEVDSPEVMAHAKALNRLGQFLVGRSGNCLNPARAAIAKAEGGAA